MGAPRIANGPLELPDSGLTQPAVATATKPRYFLGWTVVAVALLASFTEVAFFNPAIGVMSLGTRLGFAVMPIMVQLIIQSSGWRNAALALAVLVATFGVLPALKWLHPRPEAFGLVPDGDEAPVPG